MDILLFVIVMAKTLLLNLMKESITFHKAKFPPKFAPPLRNIVVGGVFIELNNWC